MPDRQQQKKSLLLFYVDFDDSLSAMNLGLKALSLEHFSTFVESYRTYLETKRSPAVEGPLFARSIRLCCCCCCCCCSSIAAALTASSVCLYVRAYSICYVVYKRGKIFEQTLLRGWVQAWNFHRFHATTCLSVFVNSVVCWCCFSATSFGDGLFW